MVNKCSLQFSLQFSALNICSLQPFPQPLDWVVGLDDSLLQAKVDISCNQPFKVSPDPVYAPVHTPHLHLAGAYLEAGEAWLPAEKGAVGLLP